MAAVATQLLPRLLSGVGERAMAHLDDHLAMHEAPPDLRAWAPRQLIELVQEAGVRGHGGAGFPVATKMRAVAARRGAAVVVANGSEGEPASKKDRVLMRELPHLVLDGAAVAARAVEAREAIIAVADDDERSLRGLGLALRERRDARFPGDPQFELFRVAPRSGSALVTLSGTLSAPGVYEIAHGMALSELLDAAGAHDQLTAVLVGGYFGTWLPASVVPAVALDGESLAEHQATLGAGVIVALGADACPVAETSRIADYFAQEGAGQCGPCVNGLDAIADAVRGPAAGTASAQVYPALQRWLTELPRRGACQHPDGAVKFISSSLSTFAAEFGDHARHGPCELCHAQVLPTPAVAPPPRHRR